MAISYRYRPQLSLRTTYELSYYTVPWARQHLQPDHVHLTQYMILNTQDLRCSTHLWVMLHGAESYYYYKVPCIIAGAVRDAAAAAR